MNVARITTFVQCGENRKTSTMSFVNSMLPHATPI
jgi:hypothetical protein